MMALDAVSTEYETARRILRDVAYYKVRSFERPDWLPLLLDETQQ